MKFSLRTKTIILIVLIAAILGTTGLLVSSRFINRIVDNSYKSKANDLARTVAEIVDVDRIAALKAEILAIYNASEDKVTSDDWGSDAFNAYIAQYAHLEESEDFQVLRRQLRQIQDVNDVDCLYLSIVDVPTELMVYLVDGAYEDACPPGCIDPLFEQNREVLVNPERGFPPYLTDMDVYGWLVTAGVPVHDADGQVLCYAFADVSMDAVVGQQRSFSLMLAGILAALTVLICFAAILVVNRVIIRPINMLSSAAAHYSQKDHDQLEGLPIRTRDEIQSLYMSIKQMTQDINQYIDNLMITTNELTRTRIKADQMDALAHKDALTGVGSKLAYDQMVSRLSGEVAQGDAAFGIVMVDMNDLKKLNDTYGHEKGNEAIRKTCRIICDVFKHSPVYRIGGDEFVIVVHDRDYDNLDALIREFNAAVQATEGQPWEKISAAIGCARYEAGDMVEDVFRRADHSMYERKKAMKGAQRR